MESSGSKLPHTFVARIDDNDVFIELESEPPTDITCVAVDIWRARVNVGSVQVINSFQWGHWYTSTATSSIHSFLVTRQVNYLFIIDIYLSLSARVASIILSSCTLQSPRWPSAAQSSMFLPPYAQLTVLINILNIGFARFSKDT